MLGLQELVRKVFLAQILVADAVESAEGYHRRSKASPGTRLVARVVAAPGPRQQLGAAVRVRGSDCSHPLGHPSKGQPQKPNLARDGILTAQDAGNGFTMARLQMAGLSLVLAGP